MKCINPNQIQPNTAGIRSKRDLHKALHGGENGNDMLQARAIVGWLLGSCILPEYRLPAKLPIMAEGSAMVRLLARAQLAKMIYLNDRDVRRIPRNASIALKKIRLRFALRLHRVDDMHPLASRITPHVIKRGVRSGTPHRAHTKVQLAGEECGGFDRPVLAGPRYTTGSRIDPTERTARGLRRWSSSIGTAELPPGEVVVFTDGPRGRKG
jgi:hypothetical protein